MGFVCFHCRRLPVQSLGERDIEIEQTQTLRTPSTPEPQTPIQPPSSTAILDPQTSGVVSCSQGSQASSNLALSQNTRIAIDSGLSSGDEIQDFEDDLLW